MLRQGIKLGNEMITVNAVISARQELNPPTANSAMPELPEIPEKTCMKVWLVDKYNMTLNMPFLIDLQNITYRSTAFYTSQYKQ